MRSGPSLLGSSGEGKVNTAAIQAAFRSHVCGGQCVRGLRAETGLSNKKRKAWWRRRKTARAGGISAGKRLGPQLFCGRGSQGGSSSALGSKWLRVHPAGAFPPPVGDGLKRLIGLLNPLDSVLREGLTPGVGIPQPSPSNTPITCELFLQSLPSLWKDTAQTSA